MSVIVWWISNYLSFSDRLMLTLNTITSMACCLTCSVVATCSFRSFRCYIIPHKMLKCLSPLFICSAYSTANKSWFMRSAVCCILLYLHISNCVIFFRSGFTLCAALDWVTALIVWQMPPFRTTNHSLSFISYIMWKQHSFLGFTTKISVGKCASCCFHFLFSNHTANKPHKLFFSELTA